MRSESIRELFPVGHILPGVALALFIVLSAASTAVAEGAVDRIVANVNGEVITEYDLDHDMKPFLERLKAMNLSEQDKLQLAGVKKKFLDHMIDNILLKGEVERLKITVSDQDVENTIKDIMTSQKITVEQLNQQLALEKTTRADYEKRIRDDILKQKVLSLMVRRKVLVTDEEIESYYQAHHAKGSQGGGSQVALGLILLPDGMDAKSLRQRIKNSELTFEEAASKYSQGPGAEHGGDIGTLAWKDLAPAWRQALEGLNPGDLTNPFPVQGFQAILKLKALDKNNVQVVVPEDERNEIRATLSKAKLEELFSDYMERLRSKAVIDVKL